MWMTEGGAIRVEGEGPEAGPRESAEQRRGPRSWEGGERGTRGEWEGMGRSESRGDTT